MMRESVLLFLEHSFTNNMVFVSFMGTLLAISEGQSVRRSFSASWKYGLALVGAAMLPWVLNQLLALSFSLFSIWIFTISAALFTWLLNKWGELEGLWHGLPRVLLAFAPMIGLAYGVWLDGSELANAVPIALGGSVGFVGAYLLTAAIREQMETSDASPIFASPAVLLIAMGVFSLALAGFLF